MIAVPSTDSISAARASRRVSRFCSAGVFGDGGSPSRLTVSCKTKSPPRANADSSSTFEVAPSLSMLTRYVLLLGYADHSPATLQAGEICV